MTKQELIIAIFQNLDALKIEKIKDIFSNQQYNASYSFDASPEELLIILTKISLIETVRDNGKIDTLSFFSLQEINVNLASLVSHTENFLSNPNQPTNSQNYFTHFKNLITSIDRYGFELLSNSRMPSFAQRERQIQEIEEILTRLKVRYDEDAVDDKIEIMQNLIKKLIHSMKSKWMRYWHLFLTLKQKKLQLMNCTLSITALSKNLNCINQLKMKKLQKIKII